ncbi:putative transcription initiation factor TFIID subunit 3 isoform X2 [Penaeus vannamei]|uniref:Putative transcription initiation factor TFIID subunit 3 isoform X2 n=1 Tax=Penaeus vannamei TaxID=6689 RepID=A0A423U5S5_PENVA|nr:putative transcription initiation factor TFIID subunit 3 isoform X2 [Penaeus vannamei]
MATPRSSSPSAASALSKKKLAVEKLIRQKNNQGGPQKPPPSKSRPTKDKGPSKPGSKPMKVLKIPKMPKIPKIPQVKPGSSMPQPSPANTPLAASTPGPPVSQGAAAPLPTPPKLKMPTPKIRVPKPPKTPKSETKKASADVTVTSIPPPAKAQEAPPDKLSIFKKIKPKGETKEADRTGEREVHPSRDSSPDLMIDENPRMAQRRPPEDLAVLDNPVPALDASMDELDCSPGDFPSYQDDMSPPGTPSTPRTPELPQLAIRKTPEKWKGKERGRERRPKKDRSKSPKCGFSPGRREHSASESETPDRPKTPEVGLPLDSLGPPSTSTPFSLPPFPNAPGFIPPFSRFPFIPPYGGPPLRPGIPPMPDLRLPPHTFLQRLAAPGSKRPLDDDHLGLDEPEPLERPLTPRHDRDFSPLPPPGHPSPLRSPSPTQSSATPPRPRTPAHHSPPPLIKVKPEKPEKSEKEKAPAAEASTPKL